MDYTEILAIAENNLIPKNEDIVKEIKLRIRSGSTGGEIGSMVGSYLKSLRDQNHIAYLTIKTDIDLYLSQFIWK
ncbi:hypothetical protein [Mucilaginibacter sp.]|uniref:hypothetical protein n=1 Tax=Mucilaginibacter sp. TaxID=1882438 RepID=UPI00284BF9FE|nr:hypothetical protein [Mucilaginibacter sp.]MDR3694291.1 hypothetical protein [Mucilaginibacter sp.]